LQLLLDCLSIVLIDLLLAGDNALVIALAVRSLPPRERRTGIAAGAAVAVALRIALTFLAAQILHIEFLKLFGGAFVLWIAVKVFSDTDAPKHEGAKARRVLHAVGLIVFADITMSTDNVLAVAGASHGNGALIVFGLCVSIPFVVMSSSLLTMLMDRYPWILYVGAAVLGKVGAEMMLTDGYVTRTLHPSQNWIYASEAAAAAGVLLVSRMVKRGNL
jgi:YjbE family integral membrane protein